MDAEPRAFQTPLPERGGTGVLDEALAAARAHHERWWDASLHRLRGELLLMYDADTSDVEAALFRAIPAGQIAGTPCDDDPPAVCTAHNRSDGARRQLSDL